MVKNKEVVDAFIRGDSEIRASNLFFESLADGVRVLYSYGYHFPLAVMVGREVFINDSSFSQTTAVHRSCVINAVTHSAVDHLVSDDVMLPLSAMKQLVAELSSVPRVAVVRVPEKIESDEQLRSLVREYYLGRGVHTRAVNSRVDSFVKDMDKLVFVNSV